MNEPKKIKKDSELNIELARLADQICDDFKYFTYGIRCLFLIHRSKEGAEESNNRKARKVISNSPESFREQLYSLLVDKHASNVPFRIYSSANARDFDKAIRKYKHDQLDIDYADRTSREEFYLNTKARFISALMVPASRDETKFMIDCDSSEAHESVLKQCSEQKIVILKMYKTKNGWHVVTEPFNPVLVSGENIEIHKDGLLLLSY